MIAFGLHPGNRLWIAPIPMIRFGLANSFARA